MPWPPARRHARTPRPHTASGRGRRCRRGGCARRGFHRRRGRGFRRFGRRIGGLANGVVRGDLRRRRRVARGGDAAGRRRGRALGRLGGTCRQLLQRGQGLGVALVDDVVALLQLRHVALERSELGVNGQDFIFFSTHHASRCRWWRRLQGGRQILSSRRCGTR